jgi:hypothetical protein
MTTASIETRPEKYGNGSSAEVLLAYRCRKTSMRLTSHHLGHPRNVTPATRWRSSRVSSIFSWPRHLTTLGSSLTVLILISCCSLSAATQPLYPPSIADPRVHAPDYHLALRAIAESGTIIVDHRPPPPGAIWSLESADNLWKRQNSGDHFSSSSSSTASPTVAATATTSGTGATGTSSSLPLPSPFDSFLDSNFTNPSCPQFIHAFLADTSFKACLPFSLLLSVSPSTNPIARI